MHSFFLILYTIMSMHFKTPHPWYYQCKLAMYRSWRPTSTSLSQVYQASCDLQDNTDLRVSSHHPLVKSMCIQLHILCASFLIQPSKNLLCILVLKKTHAPWIDGSWFYTVSCVTTLVGAYKNVHPLTTTWMWDRKYLQL